MSPDQYLAIAGPTDPASWNRYSYVENDPINAFDPFGRFLCNPDMICSGNPGGGPWCDAVGIDCPDGGEGGADYPPLTCAVTVTIGPGYWADVPYGKAKVKTWLTPIWFTYTATGGDETYTWHEFQNFFSFDLVIYQGAGAVRPKFEAYPWSLDRPLSYYDAPPNVRTYDDAPGLGIQDPHDFVAYASTTFFTKVSVDSGDGQHVRCPTVVWTNFTTIVQKNGKLTYGSGLNSVIAIF